MFVFSQITTRMLFMYCNYDAPSQYAHICPPSATPWRDTPYLQWVGRPLAKLHCCTYSWSLNVKHPKFMQKHWYDVVLLNLYVTIPIFSFFISPRCPFLYHIGEEGLYIKACQLLPCHIHVLCLRSGHVSWGGRWTLLAVSIAATSSFARHVIRGCGTLSIPNMVGLIGTPCLRTLGSFLGGPGAS